MLYYTNLLSSWGDGVALDGEYPYHVFKMEQLREIIICPSYHVNVNTAG